MNKYDKEFVEIISPIVNADEYIKRKSMLHHEDQSVYEHSLRVAYRAYKISKFFNVNINNCVIAALLHDFYKKSWIDDPVKKPFFKKHGFVHAREALDNSRVHFKGYLNDRIENAILRHMFPLNIVPPKYKEGWILTLSDKMVSIGEIKRLSFVLLLLGFNKKDN